MERFGIKEYGNKEGFKIVCSNCGEEAWLVPTSYYDEHGIEKMTLEFRCHCGNRYGATIYER